MRVWLNPDVFLQKTCHPSVEEGLGRGFARTAVTELTSHRRYFRFKQKYRAREWLKGAMREIHANCVKFTHAGSSGGLLLRTRQLEGKVRCDPQDRIEGILRYNTRQSPGSLRSEGRRGI